VKVGYVVSRFPTDAETFILRELNAVDRIDGIELALFSLYEPAEPFVHPAAERWLATPHRPSARRALAALGHWLRRRPLRLLASAGAVVAGTWRRPATLARALVTLPLAAEHARRVADERVDHLHAHFATYPALSAWLCHRLTGVPYSFTAHAHDIFVDTSFLARKLRDARFVVAISDHNRRVLGEFGGDRDTPVHVVHCGIEPDAYGFRPRLPPAEGPVRALCVASLQEHKGHEVLLRALAGADELERLSVDLVGGRDPQPLQGLARELGVEERVRFLGGLPEEEVARLLGEADLFVLPSRVARDGQMEGIPVALMEALASGLVVVASRLSGIPELVEDGRTGILAEPGDPATLRAALARALAGDGLEPAAGRATVERDFDVERTAARLAELFRA
jgi:colanic acid/amylovoran biosynthesis glycosyltransferase